ncbi:hypothetical protein NKR23_g10432 [Pleurostoma richardsiae]|uniref:Uncharacterized protein n=1 Tax=Pleurostoma richardsiae TaxID=41990 RepID=A0AA38R4I7_9PEZI|nr:hypothetical protein NKR23_g10432 [Pleurostoma richardsiae]
MARSLSKSTRRKFISRTAKLMRRREEVDSELIRQGARQVDEVTEEDYLVRKNLLRRASELAGAEKKHLREKTKALREQQRLHDKHPTTEGASDLALLRTLLWKFKCNLGPQLIDCENKLLEDETEQNGSGTADSDDLDRSGLHDEDGPESPSFGIRDATSSLLSQQIKRIENPKQPFLQRLDKGPTTSPSSSPVSGGELDERVSDEVLSHSSQEYAEGASGKGSLGQGGRGKERRKQTEKVRKASGDCNAEDSRQLAPQVVQSTAHARTCPPTTCPDFNITPGNMMAGSDHLNSLLPPDESDSRVNMLYYKENAAATKDDPDNNDAVYDRQSAHNDSNPGRDYSMSGGLPVENEISTRGAGRPRTDPDEEVEDSGDMPVEQLPSLPGVNPFDGPPYSKKSPKKRKQPIFYVVGDVDGPNLNDQSSPLAYKKKPKLGKVVKEEEAVAADRQNQEEVAAELDALRRSVGDRGCTRGPLIPGSDGLQLSTGRPSGNARPTLEEALAEDRKILAAERRAWKERLGL